MRASTVILVFTLFLGLVTVDAHGASREDNWPTWRGPNADGVATKGNPPITWSESENIKWKIKLPGKGLSTPVVWGNKLFVQTAVATGEEPAAVEEENTQGRRGPRRGRAPTVPYKFSLVCLDRNTGEILWEKTAREEIPHEGHHPTGSFASYSPVTDGEYVWASFGSRGLHCYDLDGNHKWSTDLFKMATRNGFGEGSSPALAGDAIVVLMDHQGDSKVMAFNKDTGDLIWEQNREEVTSWATPLPVTVDGTLQVITSATDFIRSYDAKTGDLIWKCSGQTSNVIPSPVQGFGRVFVTSGFRGSALQAIELGRTGDLSGTDAIAWEVNKDTPYVSSPLLYEGKIYVTRGLGAYLSCYDAQTGEPSFERQKLEGLEGIYASPVGAGGRVYISGRKGKTIVIKKSDSFEVLATNSLDDGFDASPVVIGDTLYLKGTENLYCIAEQ